MSNHTLHLLQALESARQIAQDGGTIMVVVFDPTDEFAEEGQTYGYCPAAAYDILYGTLDRAKLAWVEAIINPNGKTVWSKQSGGAHLND